MSAVPEKTIADQPHVHIRLRSRSMREVYSWVGETGADYSIHHAAGDGSSVPSVSRPCGRSHSVQSLLGLVFLLTASPISPTFCSPLNSYLQFVLVSCSLLLFDFHFIFVSVRTRPGAPLHLVGSDVVTVRFVSTLRILFCLFLFSSSFVSFLFSCFLTSP